MNSFVLASFGIAILFATIGFLISLAVRDAGIADVFWGSYFIAIAMVLLVISDKSAIQVVDALIVTVWGLRLSWHIGRRRIGKPEDFRYHKYRKQWGKSFALRSYLNHFLYQALIAVTVSASTIVAAQAGTIISNFGFWQYLGILIWIIGFVIESISDLQLSTFIKNRISKNEIMQQGLWKYSRHPNYFGEIVQWWGLWVYVINLPLGLRAIISPVTITIFIIFVSGIPLLEERYKNNKTYKRYAKKTNILVPFPPKS
jgi:steroid 5-alpha reductase family enzyme